MSLFKVYGVTETVAKTAGIKAVDKYSIKKRPKCQSDYIEAAKIEAAKCFEKMKPVALSRAFDTPERAYEFIELTKRTVKHRDLHVMVHLQKKDATGKVMLSPKGKPLMQWKRYHDGILDGAKVA